MVAVSTPPAALARKPRDVRTAVSVVLALALLLGIPWLAFTSLYSPIGTGNLSGLGENVAWVTDGLEKTSVIVTGPEGTIGVMGFGLTNDGPVPIRIDGPVVEGLESGTRPLRGAQWSQFVDAGGRPVGDRWTRREFPTTLRQGEQITVWLQVRKYDCQGGLSYVDRVPLRWSVLGRSRQTEWMLTEPHELTAPIAYCYPDSALKHISR